MKPEVENLVQRAMEFYQRNGLVMSLDISFCNDYFPSQFHKGVSDTAWILNNGNQFDMWTEGESMDVKPNSEINNSSIETAFINLTTFIQNQNMPIHLKIIINPSKSLFRFCLMDLKQVENSEVATVRPFSGEASRVINNVIGELDISQ